MADTLNLLLIEDDADVSDDIALTLRQEGHIVKMTHTLAGAERQLSLAQINGTPFDAILSDFWLEHPSHKTPGTETYALVRQFVGPEVPLLCASSDIVMWERIKEENEDDRMYTMRKEYGLGNRNYWNPDWVKTILATVKDLPPLPKKRPGILLAGKDPSFLQSTTRALEKAGFQVTVVDGFKAAGDHLMPRNGRKSGFVAVISDFELEVGSGQEMVIIAQMRKPSPAFIATGADLDQWTETNGLVTKQGLPLHLVPQDPTLYLAKLTELGLTP